MINNFIVGTLVVSVLVAIALIIVIFYVQVWCIKEFIKSKGKDGKAFLLIVINFALVCVSAMWMIQSIKYIINYG